MPLKKGLTMSNQNITTIYLRKNSNKLDMRFKSNREFVKLMDNGKS
jgi:hypothetical protein